MIFIIGRQPFLSHNLPKKTAGFDPVFTFGFTAIFFYRGRLLALCPTPNLEDQISVFIFSRNQVSQLFSQAPDPLFVGFCDSQGYSGGILPASMRATDNNKDFKKPIPSNKIIFNEKFCTTSEHCLRWLTGGGGSIGVLDRWQLLGNEVIWVKWPSR
jgi:hypothetical protein